MDPNVTADLEAPKDPGALKAHASVSDNEILGMYMVPVAYLSNYLKTTAYQVIVMFSLGSTSPAAKSRTTPVMVITTIAGLTIDVGTIITSRCLMRIIVQVNMAFKQLLSYLVRPVLTYVTNHDVPDPPCDFN